MKVSPPALQKAGLPDLMQPFQAASVMKLRPFLKKIAIGVTLLPIPGKWQRSAARAPLPIKFQPLLRPQEPAILPLIRSVARHSG